MRHAAGTLGTIAGLIGIFVGLFGYGSATLVEQNPEVFDMLDVFENPAFIKLASFLAPPLAIAGGAMARFRAFEAGLLLIAAACLFYAGFGFNVATMFPIGFAGLAGVLAIMSRRPDEERAH